MATTVIRQKWRLKTFSHLKQGSKKEAGNWKHFEAVDGKTELMFNIGGHGNAWVTQSQELLEFTSLGTAGSVKVQQNSETLVIRSSVQGEVRIMRMMFAGGSKEEAVEQCSRAAAKLKQFAVTSPPPAAPSCTPPPPPPHQSPAGPSAPGEQTGPVDEVMDTESEVAEGSLSIRHLAQSLLGQRTLSLPEMYQHLSQPAGDDLGPFVRMCLLDPSFPAYVEEVEAELKKLTHD